MHAEQAQLAEVGGELADGHLAGFEPLRNVRAQPLLAELANDGAQLDVLGGQQRVEVEQVIDRGGCGHAECLHRAWPSSDTVTLIDDE